MKLAIPIVRNDAIYTDVDVQAPTTGVLASAHRISNSGDDFSALAALLAGIVVRLYNEEDDSVEPVSAKENQQLVSALCQNMAYRAAEVVVLEGLKLVHEDHSIEGVYPCPRCDTQSIAELITGPDGQSEDDIDMRDNIDNMPIVVMEDHDKLTFTQVFSEPVVIINKANNQVLQEVRSVTLGHPTMRNCIAAHQQVGGRDAMRLQFATYLETMTHVNGEAIDKKWKNQYGMLVFDNIKNVKDVKELSTEIAQWGLDNKVEKCCRNCGKVWKATIPTMRFFSSALQATR